MAMGSLTINPDLYLNEPGELGVVYVAPLGGGCAWIGRIDSDVRVSVCKAKAERV